MQRIIINNDERKQQPAQAKLLNPNVQYGKYFEEFVESQKKGPKPDGSVKKKGIDSEGAANLRYETMQILNHCNPHNAVGNEETTHLVVGYVQSGKTMSFTALTALARDNGYRVVVYLAGSKKNLLNQTESRLQKDLIGKDLHNKNVYKLHSDPVPSDTEQIAGHLQLSSSPMILIPILKHYQHINNLTSIFTSESFKEAIEGETVLIIDDEADQASLNAYGRKNSQKDESDEDAEDLTSKTYEAILRMRAALPGNTYIQYTATPHANLLISMEDLLSPKSHTLLTPGNGYVGGKLFFGMGPNHELFNGKLIVDIPKDEVYHKKRNPLKQMPQSLKKALMFHILAVAIVTKYYKVDDVNYLSMMVHPDNTKKVNRKFKKWIDNQLKIWKKVVGKPEGNDDRMDFEKQLRSIFPKAVEDYEVGDRPLFSDILPLVPDVLNDYNTYLINSDKDADKKIPWDAYSMHVLVGAEMLNRGFTIENLATTYMPRYSTGAAMADTIEQRCRFFGYKMDYIRSCRVFLPSFVQEEYCDYVNHEEELRSVLASCDTLEEAERKILLTPRLKPTRQNVLPVTVVNERLRGIHGMQAFESKTYIESNTRLVSDFLHQHEHDFNREYKYNTLDRTHRGFDLSIEEAISFLDSFRFGNMGDARRKAATIRYLRYLNTMDSNPIHSVHFIQMAYGAPARERAFDNQHKKLVQGGKYFAGPSSEKDSTDYPGDQKIVGGEDTITIQLHHLTLKGASLDYPHDAYTLAIYYPEALAISYCHNVPKQEQEEED